MGSMRGRIAKLEERSAERGILETSMHESGLSAPEWHCQRAWARASQGERDEIERFIEEGNETEYLRKWEEVLRLEAPTLADDVRCRRDGLYRELTRIQRDWEEQGRSHSTWQSDRPYWALSTAQANRRTAIHRGADLVTDPVEVERLIDQITDPATTTKEVLNLIGWRG